MKRHGFTDCNELIDALVEECATPQQLAAADELLRTSSLARKRYAEQMFLVSMLGSIRTSLGSLGPGESQIPRVSKRTRWSVAGGLATSIACLLIYWTLHSPSTESSPSAITAAIEENSEPSLARLITGDDYRLTGETFSGGSKLDAGTYQLSKGAIALRFENGVELSLESPTAFELVNAKRVVLEYGKVLAKVPETGLGFIVVTPKGDVEDLGTEFGVEVGIDRSTMLQVFSGEVELHRPGKRSVRLKEGFAMTLGTGEKPRRTPANDVKFLGSEDISFRRWKASSETLRKDPAAVVYYDFEHDSGAPQILKDRSTASPTLDGTVYGSRWGNGRWQGKGALLLDQDTDYVDLNIPGTFNSCTIHLWLCVNRIYANHHAILTSDVYDRGRHHWQIRRTGELRSTLRGGSSVTAGTIIPGQWTHLVLVMDREQQIASYYINGELISESFLNLDVPITFGKMTLGAYRAASALGNTAVRRHLRAWLDELAVFNRPFSADEVRQLYEAGKVP